MDTFRECMKEAARAAKNEQEAATATNYQEAVHWRQLYWRWMDKAVAEVELREQGPPYYEHLPPVI